MDIKAVYSKLSLLPSAGCYWIAPCAEL